MVSRRFYGKVNTVLKSKLERKYLQIETDYLSDPIIFNINGIEGATIAPNFGIASMPTPIPIEHTSAVTPASYQRYVGQEIDITSFELSLFTKQVQGSVTGGHFRLMVFQYFPEITISNVADTNGVIESMFSKLSNTWANEGDTLISNVYSSFTNGQQENMLALYDRPNAQNYAILHDQIYRYDQMSQVAASDAGTSNSDLGAPFTKFLYLNIVPPEKTAKLDLLSFPSDDEVSVTNWIFWILHDLTATNAGVFSPNFGCVARLNFTDA